MNTSTHFFTRTVDMLCVANFDGYFVDVNPAFCEGLGYTREELLSQPYLNFVHPDDVPATAHEVALVEGGTQTSLHFENRYRHKRGHYVTLSWSSTTDAEEKLVYGVARNVTEQANVRHRLLQIEQALEQDAFVVTTDPEKTIVSVNDRFCEATGHAPEELIGRSCRELLADLCPSGDTERSGPGSSAPSVSSGIVEVETKGRDRLAVQWLVTPIFDHQDDVSHFLALGHDITADLRNREDLARTIGILNETNAIARVGGWELDVATGELEWTDETFRILEVDKKQGRKPMLPEGLSLFTPEYQPVIERAVSRAIEFGEPYSLELEAQTARGNVLWVYTNGKANYKDGKVVTLSGTIQDIHARKTAEALLEQERRRVLRQSKMASLGELAAAMAHELNNPVAIVSAAAEVALTEEIPETVRENLDDILKSCDRMAHIVRNLKRFSRTDDTRQDHKTHSVETIVEESLFLVKPRLKRELVDISVDASTDGRITCSSIEIEQILVNLLNNAMDAVKKLEERWISVRVTESPRDLTISVTDSGSGVPACVEKELFTPFRTTKAPGEGTGLGLAISRQIAEEHGGTLSYELADGHTCFRLTLPREQDDAHAP